MTATVKVGQLLCQKNSYIKTIKAIVNSCTPKGNLFEVILNDTILFPTGGGQPHDLGTINDIPVIKIVREGLECIHITESPFEIGEEVLVALDWVRRFDHMQQHSGQHLISDIAESEFGWITFGWNMGVEKSFVEFENILPKYEDIMKLEKMVNEYIRRGLPVSVTNDLIREENRPDTLPEDIVAGVLRKVKIGDIPESPCCGTHVSHTADIQVVKFLNVEKIRGSNSRLWFLVGERVIKAFEVSLKLDSELSKLLDAKAEQFPERVNKILQQRKEYMKSNKKLEKELKELRKEIEKGHQMESKS